MILRALFCIFPLLLAATEAVKTEQPVPTPEEIQQDIDREEAQFERAKKMFVPWYTGPLITPSPSLIAPGSIMLQPYVFNKETYATFNNERHSVGAPHDTFNFNPFIVAQTGITKNMDFTTIIQGDVNWLNGQSSGGYGDMTFSPGFLIFKQTRFVPQMKAFVQITVPTGEYENLNPNKSGLEAIGGGSVQTEVGVIFGKVIFWQYQHPMNLRLSLGYTIPSSVHVHGFNTYGGGYGTKGVVYPGGTFGTDLGMELSLSEAWVLAMDVVYTSQGDTLFYGTAGTTTPNGTIAAEVGSPSNDNLSLAPALEYNFNSDLGIIAGVQFSVYGRNSGNFINGIISVCWVYE